MTIKENYDRYLLLILLIGLFTTSFFIFKEGKIYISSIILLICSLIAYVLSFLGELKGKGFIYWSSLLTLVFYYLFSLCLAISFIFFSPYENSIFLLEGAFFLTSSFISFSLLKTYLLDKKNIIKNVFKLISFILFVHISFLLLITYSIPEDSGFDNISRPIYSASLFLAMAIFLFISFKKIVNRSIKFIKYGYTLTFLLLFIYISAMFFNLLTGRFPLPSEGLDSLSSLFYLISLILVGLCLKNTFESSSSYKITNLEKS